MISTTWGSWIAKKN